MFWAEAMQGYKQSAISTARAFLVPYGEKPEDDANVFGLLAGLAAADKSVSTALSGATSALMGVNIADPAPGVTTLRDVVSNFTGLAADRFAPVPHAKFPVSTAPDTATVQQKPVANGGVTLLDLTGVACPMNFVKTKLKLETLPAGAHLAVILDDGEPIANVPRSLEEQGQQVLAREKISASQWKILIEKST